jgi:glucosamine kinase
VTELVIGIDGGGSRTRAMLADEHGTAIGRSEGPASRVAPGSAEHSASVIEALVRDVLAGAALASLRPRAICVGVAGVGRGNERQALWQALHDRDLADEIIVHTDAAIALEDAFGDGSGVLLIGGTGSVAYGRGPTGTFARCGGWGPVIGDEGSGAWIGRRALSIVTAASDGREPETALTGAVLTATEVADVPDLIPWAATAATAQIAALAPVVMSAAAAGDRRANALVTLAAEELMLHARALARELFVDERASFALALAGGLLGRGSLLRKRLEIRLKSGVPGAQLHAEEVVPVRGAVRGALRSLGFATTA